MDGYVRVSGVIIVCVSVYDSLQYVSVRWCTHYCYWAALLYMCHVLSSVYYMW